jgi:hypothetical protein
MSESMALVGLDVHQAQTAVYIRSVFDPHRACIFGGIGWCLRVGLTGNVGRAGVSIRDPDQLHSAAERVIIDVSQAREYDIPMYRVMQFDFPATALADGERLGPSAKLLLTWSYLCR